MNYVSVLPAVASILSNQPGRYRFGLAPAGGGADAASLSTVTPVLAQAHDARPARQRRSIRPLAMLDVVRRRGRRWGLLAQYEEARLGLPR